MVAVDSVAALVPRAELEGEIGQTQGGWAICLWLGWPFAVQPVQLLACAAARLSC